MLLVIKSIDNGYLVEYTKPSSGTFGRSMSIFYPTKESIKVELVKLIEEASTNG